MKKTAESKHEIVTSSGLREDDEEEELRYGDQQMGDIYTVSDWKQDDNVPGVFKSLKQVQIFIDGIRGSKLQVVLLKQATGIA